MQNRVFAESDLRKAEPRFWSKVTKSEGCWLWRAGIDSDGYGAFKVTHTQQSRAHRFAWLVTRGEIGDGLWVLHRCDTPACVNPDHLFLGTSDDNIADMVAKGRNTIGKGRAYRVPPPARARGERAPAARLTWVAVTEIRQRLARGETKKNLAAEYGVTPTAIYLIGVGKNWARPDLGNGCSGTP